MEGCEEMPKCLCFAESDALNKRRAVRPVKGCQRASRVWISTSGNKWLNPWKRDRLVFLSFRLTERRESKTLWYLSGGGVELTYVVDFRMAVKTLRSNETARFLLC
jgi:hypothetical protein